MPARAAAGRAGPAEAAARRRRAGPPVHELLGQARRDAGHLRGRGVARGQLHRSRPSPPGADPAGDRAPRGGAGDGGGRGRLRRTAVRAVTDGRGPGLPHAGPGRSRLAGAEGGRRHAGPSRLDVGQHAARARAHDGRARPAAEVGRRGDGGVRARRRAGRRVQDRGRRQPGETAGDRGAAAAAGGGPGAGSRRGRPEAAGGRPGDRGRPGRRRDPGGPAGSGDAASLTRPARPACRPARRPA